MTLTVRLAWRNLRRAASKHVVVALLIAIPSFAGTVVAIANRSTAITDYDYFRAEFGSAEYGLGGQSKLVADRMATDLADAGGDVLVRQVRWVSAPIRAEVIAVDLRSPLSDGMFISRSGRAPIAPGEVAVSDRMAERLGLELGGMLPTAAGRSATVVGIVKPALQFDSDRIFIPPQPGEGLSVDDFVSVGVSGLSEAEIQAVLADYPGSNEPRSADQVRNWNSRFSNGPVDPENRPEQAGTLTTGLLLIEAGLLTAAAFAIGARRRVTELGRLMAIGAGPKELTRIMLAEAGVLSLLASMTGAGLGLLTAELWTGRLATLGYMISGARTEISNPEWHVLDLLGPILLATAVGTLSAWFPARRAAAMTAVAAQADATDRAAPGRYVLPASLAAVVASMSAIAMASWLDGRGRGGDAAAALGIGAALGLIAAVVGLAGLVLHRWGDRATRWPTTLRLALRMSARNRLRSVTVLTAVAALIGTGTFAATVILRGEGGREPLAGSTLVASYGQRQDHWLDVADIGAPAPSPATFDLPGTTTMTANRLSVPGIDDDGTEGADRTEFVYAQMADDGEPTAILNVLVADQQLIDFLGLDQQAVAALADPGAAMVVDSTLTRSTIQLQRAGSGPSTVIGSLDAVHLPDERLAQVAVDAIIGPQAAARHTLPTERDVGLATNPNGYTSDELSIAEAAGYQVARGAGVGLSDGFWWSVQLIVGLVVAVVVLVVYRTVAGLIAAETERDSAIMASIGAPNRGRRLQLGAQAFIHLMLAATLAIPLGWMAAIISTSAYERRLSMSFSETPLALMVGLLVVLPALTALLNFLTTRSAGPALSRRMT